MGQSAIIRVLYCMTILSVLTTSVVAPIPGLPFLDGLLGESTTDEPDPATNDVDPTKEESLSAGKSASAAGAFDLNKGIHLGSPKIGSLDANLNISGSKGIAASKGITKGDLPDPDPILFPLPPPQRKVPILILPPRPLPPPPTPCPPQQQQHFNVHNLNNRPRY